MNELRGLAHALTDTYLGKYPQEVTELLEAAPNAAAMVHSLGGNDG